jgi:hypothetical protein
LAPVEGHEPATQEAKESVASPSAQVVVPCVFLPELSALPVLHCVS